MLNFASCTTFPTCRKHLAFFCEFGVVLSYRKPIQAQYTKRKIVINRFCEFCVISAEFCQAHNQTHHIAHRQQWFLVIDLQDYVNSMYGVEKEDRLFPITKYYLEHEMQRGIKQSGVKRIRIHDIRHSHASMLVELGFSPLEIANRLGHEKIETTLNTYSHLYPNKQEQLADRLDAQYREGLQ